MILVILFIDIIQAQYAFVYDAVLDSSVEGTHEVCADTLECSFNKWKQCSRNTRSILEKQFEVIINEIVFFTIPAQLHNFRC